MGLSGVALAAAAACGTLPGALALKAAGAAGADERGSILVTTGYWRLDNSHADAGGLRNGPGGYLKSMHKVMSLNTDIAIYGDAFGVENMQLARGEAKPALAGAEVLEIESLEPCKSHGAEMRANVSKYTHPLHMHSITLACIWDGKFSLVGRSFRKYPGYDWYAWLDIGMHGGAEMDKNMLAWGNKPWPSASRLAKLPTDKISASGTGYCGNFKEGDYRFGHCVAATVWVIPARIVEDVVALFYEELEKCFRITKDQDESYQCLSEQVIMTHMEVSRPGLYNFIGKGYGTGIMNNFTTDLAELDGPSDLFSWLGAEDGQVTTMLAADRKRGLD
ncbi:unnamed protein product [Prorocentrum cordatum]|uniref:Uncharacterized protein n=1 Tax=Prorocentrum cordatum TaxID=2364126 RepID=A0ABN9UTK8_9DINO|nr:unnamed protein product [Polarella glacialis]